MEIFILWFIFEKSSEILFGLLIFSYAGNEGEHEEHKNNWNTTKRRHRKRRREHSSSGESESEQGNLHH